MSKKYKVVIEFEVDKPLSEREKAQITDAMSVQYESLSDGDIACKKAVLTSATIHEEQPYEKMKG